MWYIFYKGKAQKDTLTANLQKAGMDYYLPVLSTEYYEDGQMRIREKEVLRNLIFVNTEDDIKNVAKIVDGLHSPYIDNMTGQPAKVSDVEMNRFMRFVELKSMGVRLLQDPYRRFKKCQKVRVRAGEFAGVEGYVFRIRGDRKLVISLGDMAVAISGIHHTLLEPVEEE